MKEVNVYKILIPIDQGVQLMVSDDVYYFIQHEIYNIFLDFVYAFRDRVNTQTIKDINS